MLAQHIAHLFIRDPISLFAEKVEQDEDLETDHFEVSQSRHNPLLNPLPLPLPPTLGPWPPPLPGPPQNIQSTNWQSMRFKPPPPNSGIGWRVEFRPLELQLTDFENAAFVVFVVLLTRAILSFKLNLYIPITKVGMIILYMHDVRVCDYPLPVCM